ncbi:uncharacterized protein LOC117172304 [Belonocnema kinseyi]|uniref:uncharacterized protein LOC117172304 n=1 Tax=Belonocnema kinseyi TaxID=2817044 RepID=UPI00143DFF44|nr:uncharacterized protein LOC117172304 [Belonocnema kinseyi]XP_033215978.1 uncharacterized protein LOC117172304 [Belonocnema kinseyi]
MTKSSLSAEKNFLNPMEEKFAKKISKSIKEMASFSSKRKSSQLLEGGSAIKKPKTVNKIELGVKEDHLASANYEDNYREPNQSALIKRLQLAQEEIIQLKRQLIDCMQENKNLRAMNSKLQTKVVDKFERVKASIDNVTETAEANLRERIESGEDLPIGTVDRVSNTGVDNGLIKIRMIERGTN